MPLNLVQHRSEPNVWDHVADDTDWDVERWLFAAASGACLISAIRHRSALLLAGGGLLAWWAARGVDDRQQKKAQLRAVLPIRECCDEVGEASQESFPASDAPSWTPTTANTGPAAPASRRH